ncbi:MAG: cupin domain-containing protein, partial [Gaiellaceae bacterium]
MDVPPLLGGSIDGREFVVAEWVDDNESSAAQPVAPLHVHHADDEAWYVLEGTLGFIRGDERLEARAGSAVLVPRGSEHTFWNAAGARTRYLIVMTPKIAALIEA